ncbi:unnamed protein product [Acidocella sp. C78]|uniref:GspH/FimT family protein n=1 Tax=Acidocella sp. C78 TaxID=1671486 RepID=UPI00191B916D|nr:GspH/FimT family protein [Acidocella sp. C78]CAG4914557.1 unnamed protein product [Acidocella sp. C78]
MPSPTEPAPTELAADDRGYTLLELLVVVVILGLALTLAATAAPWRRIGHDPATAAATLVGALRTARAVAITTGRRSTFAIAPADGNWVGPGERGSLPRGIAIAFHGPAARGWGRIVFSPDGSATGGRILLSRGAARALVTVDWLTGRISTDAPPR